MPLRACMKEILLLKLIISDISLTAFNHISEKLFTAGKVLLAFVVSVFGFVAPLPAQEINFGSFGSYSLFISDLTPAEDLAFGIVIKNEGLKEIPLIDAKVLALEGVKYLDVIMEITADNALLLNGDLDCIGDPACSLPFTLKAAYANRGQNDTNQAEDVPVTANTAVARFPILHRGNLPPGPPPTPPHEGYNPALYHETAYIYLYGAVTVGNLNAGEYSGEITVTIIYD